MANANLALTHKTESRSQYNAVTVFAPHLIWQLHCQYYKYIWTLLLKPTYLNLVYKRLSAIVHLLKVHRRLA